jgi:hypothetical protein
MEKLATGEISSDGRTRTILFRSVPGFSQLKSFENLKASIGQIRKKK